MSTSKNKTLIKLEKQPLVASVLIHRALAKAYPAAVKKSPQLGKEVKKEYEEMTRKIEARTVRNAYTLPTNAPPPIKLTGPRKPSPLGPGAPKFNFKPLPAATLKRRIVEVKWNDPM